VSRVVSRFFSETVELLLMKLKQAIQPGVIIFNTVDFRNDRLFLQILTEFFFCANKTLLLHGHESQSGTLTHRYISIREVILHILQQYSLN